MSDTAHTVALYDYAPSQRPEIAQLLPAEYQTVLEIGCAKGGFRASLLKQAEVWGVEPNEAAARTAQGMGYKVLVGTYDTVADECPDDYFDLIVCNDVIEHMVDHDRFLSAIQRKMKQRACIVGSVPNVRYFGNIFKLLVLADWKYEEQGILDRTHLRFFTAKSLARTFEQHGYRVERLVGVNSEFSRDLTTRQFAKSALLLLTIVASLGRFADFRFLQFGFKLTLGPGSKGGA